MSAVSAPWFGRGCVVGMMGRTTNTKPTCHSQPEPGSRCTHRRTTSWLAGSLTDQRLGIPPCSPPLAVRAAVQLSNIETAEPDCGDVGDESVVDRSDCCARACILARM